MQTNNILREACVENFQQCSNAEKNGANRVELCADLANAGTTPSYGLIKMTRENLKIPILVMIRPRGGNFIYDEPEIQIMKYDIQICQELCVEGVAFGILTEQNKIDVEKMKHLMCIVSKTIPKLEVTFHMAFDLIENKFEAIDQLVELGINRILTKGCETNAVNGKENIKKYIEYSNNRIIIIAGGGVTQDNYNNISVFTGCTEVHGTKIVGKI